jgi:hypothetical protein
MDALKHYLRKKNIFPPFISEPPAKRLKYAVIIPVFNEPDLPETLRSLANADQPDEPVEIILVINGSGNTPDWILKQNRKTKQEVEELTKQYNFPLKIHIIHKENLSPDIMGAGYARKIGMDEAIHRFESINREDGILISLDADTKCDKNYFTTIEKKVKQNPKLNAGIIFFEHPIEGSQFSENVYKAITQYELFLRYYKQALHYCGFPFTFHTIGSAFFVKALAYVKQGGMSQRKAGEDFYFLNKLFQLGNIQEITETHIHPSPRPSDRVLFGTGPEIIKFTEQTEQDYMTYNPDFFSGLKQFFSMIERFYNNTDHSINNTIQRLPMFIQTFLKKNKGEENIQRILKNCKSSYIFRKHFFLWFNGLKIIRLIHEAHETSFNKIPLFDAAKIMLEYRGFRDSQIGNYKELLNYYRNIELNHPVSIK